MKELTIEQKARAYDEALERAMKFLNKELFAENSECAIKHIFPELAESEDERIREYLIRYIDNTMKSSELKSKLLAWLEKQGEEKPTQEIEPFEAEHGKYYYCIKDYFCGGRKQASKGDVVQALRGLPIMGLKDASEYFLPVNFIKCNSAWSEEDEKMIGRIRGIIEAYAFSQSAVDVNGGLCEKEYIEADNWLNSLKERIGE